MCVEKQAIRTQVGNACVLCLTSPINIFTDRANYLYANVGGSVIFHVEPEYVLDRRRQISRDCHLNLLY